MTNQVLDKSSIINLMQTFEVCPKILTLLSLNLNLKLDDDLVSKTKNINVTKLKHVLVLQKQQLQHLT